MQLSPRLILIHPIYTINHNFIYKSLYIFLFCMELFYSYNYYIFLFILLIINMGKSSTSFSKGFWKEGFGIIMKKLQKRIMMKQGHFVVIATQGWKPERFCVELEYLDHPEFVKLLKQAEEEFGFSQDGAIAIPCEPDELKRIIGRKKQHINIKGIDITC